MAKRYEQAKNNSIIFCPQHGRLSTLPEQGYCQDKAGDSHFFFLAYCSGCQVYYATYALLAELMVQPKYQGVPIRIVAPLSPHEAKRIDDARAQAARQKQREEEAARRTAIETKTARAEWEEIFNPKDMEFAALYAESIGKKQAKPLAQSKPQPAPTPTATKEIARDPYAKQEPLTVETVYLTQGSLKACPLHTEALLQDGNAWLMLKDGKRKKLAGRICPHCNSFFANQHSFHSLRLPLDLLQTHITEELPLPEVETTDAETPLPENN